MMAEDDQLSTREFDARIEEIKRAVDLARDSAGPIVELKEYVETLFKENHRATEMAEREREKAALVLNSDRRDAAEIAEREREKAAQALRTGLDRAITDGDQRLREHIFDQVHQLKESLGSANGLEVERFERAKAEVEALRRELLLVQDAQVAAVNKAERAQKEVNIRGNDFRGQLADQAASLMPRKEVEALVNDIRNRVDGLLPRETFETAVASIERRLTANTSSLDRGSGKELGAEGTKNEQRADSQVSLGRVAAMIAAGGLAVTLFMGMVVVLVGVLTSGGP